ncbi:hypothetical protein [Microbacterium sp. 18062]|uniref:hypothetical protein n=1 Tax=Microbacterium sp. 18062 TaxID=2681410 RepID=UPI0027D3129B|nr:hypothetical protein [Microbacterium sp. 18062]
MPPAAAISAAARSGSLAASPAITTRAPAAASASATARPMPVAPPVTIATCPAHKNLPAADAVSAPLTG